MIRVLQLLDQHADLQTRYLAAALAERANGKFQSIKATMGPGGQFRGFLDAASWLAQPNRIDIVHAWSERALLAASLFSDAPIVFTAPPGGKKPWWFRAVGKRRNMHLSNDIAPGISFPPAVRDDAIRRQIGFSADDLVVLAPGESTRAADHLLSLWTVGILHELNPQWRLLIWGRGPLAAGIKHMAVRLGRPRLVESAPALKLETLPAAADFALITANKSAGVLAAGMCMCAGLPIVTTSRLFTDHRNALVVPDRSPRTMVQKLLELQTDPQLQNRLIHQAKQDTATRWNMKRFLDAHQNLYARTSLFSRLPALAPANTPLTRPDSSLPGHVLR